MGSATNMFINAGEVLKLKAVETIRVCYMRYIYIILIMQALLCCFIVTRILNYFALLLPQVLVDKML